MSSIETLNHPFNASSLGVVLDLLRILDFLKFVVNMRSTSGARELYNAVTCLDLVDVISLDRYQEFDAVAVDYINKRVDPEWRNEFTGDSVIHAGKFPLRRNDLESPVDVKFTGINGLIKVAIIKNDISRISLT